MSENSAIIMFNKQTIRRTWHEDQWWFSVVDICGALTNSADAGAYWRKLKQRLLTTDESQVVTNFHGLKLQAPDGKQYITDCTYTEGGLRIIQSIPSPNNLYFESSGVNEYNNGCLNHHQ